MANEGEFPKIDGDVLYASEVNAMPPVGSIMAWLKTFTNCPTLPENWVECNGQTLSDANSVFNGQVIPDLNGENYFLRGNSTSGGTGGVASIGMECNAESGDDGANRGYGLDSYHGGAFDNRPPYYNIVWIVKIK